MTVPTLECPKCARTVPEAPECTACGVVFAKLRDREARPVTGALLPEPENRPAERADPMSPPPHSSPRPAAISGASQAASRSPAALWGFLLVAAFGALAAVQWFEGWGQSPDALATAGVVNEFEPGRAANGTSASGDSSSVAAAKERLAALSAPPARTTRPGAAKARLANSQRTPPAASGPALASGAVSSPQAAERRWVPPDSTWFEGARGFEKGLARARDKDQAALVYFYADWCGYCRQLESDLLDRAVVQEYTKYLVKIRINPEKGASERAIADTYGVKGYPSLFVHPAGLGAPKKVRSMTRKSGKWRSVETREYVDRLAAAAGERFGAS